MLIAAQRKFCAILRKMKNDWIVVIPSYNRVETLKEKTLKTLQTHNIPAKKIWVFVANEDQKKLYKEGLGDSVGIL